MSADILIIQHHIAEGAGNIAKWLALNNLSYHINLLPAALPENIDDYQGVIVLGGPMHVDKDNPRLAQELKIIKQFIDLDKAVLGICLGGQLVASALGAKIVAMPTPEHGWLNVTTHNTEQLMEHLDEQLEARLGEQLLVPQWHQQQFTLPEGATLLGSSEQCRNQMFRYKQHVLALQFHPEWNNSSIQELQEYFVEQCPLQTVSNTHIDGLEVWWFKVLDTWWQDASVSNV
ncbi:type 1 glutamine amidotransferase [Thalassotalea sp. HSM 43]|uniref:type 1 glutamine amidotransferase n=1 Tax=Thalassotalea sp. HSM 43 TaxID=2552945 RepID=UPI001080E636|nr:type 1 glutamine amidotransferase [Thalassotalea sp. HSM 43]QBY05398.1 type 1 glutamine amidotransferase [Thalassotalea sp. HSM 43]